MRERLLIKEAHQLPLTELCMLEFSETYSLDKGYVLWTGRLDDKKVDIYGCWNLDKLRQWFPVVALF